MKQDKNSKVKEKHSKKLSNKKENAKASEKQFQNEIKDKNEYLKNSQKIFQYEDESNSRSGSGNEITNRRLPSNYRQPKEKKTKLIVTTLISLLIIVIIAIIVIFIVKPWKKKSPNGNNSDSNPYNNNNNGNEDANNNNNNNNNNGNEDANNNNNNNNGNEDDKNDDNYINPPEVTLTEMKRLTINRNTEEDLLIEGMNTIVYLYKKNIYNISNYLEYDSSKGKIYTYSILLLKSCLNTEREIENCDITDEENSNLKNSEQIPLCLFNISDNKIILSVKCPNYLDENEKLNIISDLNYLADFINNEENNIRNLDSSDNTKSCGINCKENKIITINNNSTYAGTFWKNITNSVKNQYRIKTTINIEQVKLDLDILFYDKIYRKLVFDNLPNIYQTLKIDNEIEDINENEHNINEIDLFSIDIKDFKISLKNRIEKKNGTLKAYLIYKINNKEQKLNDYINKTIELKEIENSREEINNIYLSGKKLKEGINLEDIILKISQYVNDLNNKTNKIDLDKILESLIIKKQHIQNLIAKLDNLNTSIQSTTINPYDEINSNISKSNALIGNILNDNKELIKLLNLQQNINSKIANYYTINTSNSISALFQNTINIYTDYKNERNLINKEIEDMFNKIKNNIDLENSIQYIYDFLSFYDISDVGNELNNMKEKLNGLKNNMEQVIKNEEDELKNKINIIEQDNTYDTIINQIKQKNESLNVPEEIDKIYDDLMLNFKENFTNLLIYLNDEKNRQFPLSEKILKDDYFNAEEEQSIKNEIETLSNNIINKVKEQNYLYSNNLQKKINELLNNKTELESSFNDLNNLCSENNLEELKQSFEEAYTDYLNKIKNNIDKIFNYYSEYLNDDTKILNKYNLEKVSISKKNLTYKLENLFQEIQNYIYNDLISDLTEEFNDIPNKIKKIIVTISKYKLDDKYKNFSDLSFINENKEIMDSLYENISQIFSLDNFKNEYEKKINNIAINNSLSNMKSLLDLHEKGKKCSDKEKDIFFTLDSNTYCINIFEDLNDEMNFKFSKINDDSSFIVFKKKLNIFYDTLEEITNSYDEKIGGFFSYQPQIQNEEISVELNSFQNKINSLLSDKFEGQLIINIYNYYKNNIEERIENILSEFLIRANNTFYNLKDEIIKNLDKFKYDINEFFYLSFTYYNILTQNVSKNYFDSVIETQKIDFNYTILYYYNRLQNLVNSTCKNIINNLSLNKNGLNINISEISNKFNEIFEKIENSKKEYLSINRQTYTLSIPKTNFFKVNSILSSKVLESINILEKANAEIKPLDSDQYTSQQSYISKLYSELSINAFQIKEIYKNALEDNKFIELNPENFKEIIIDNLKFDRTEFINRINTFLNNMNIKESQIYQEKMKIFQNSIEKEIKDYFHNENKNGVYDKVNYLYNNELKFTDNQIEEIYKNINEILDKILDYLNLEKKRIEKDESSYRNDYSKIYQRLHDYKNRIYTFIEDKISQINNIYKENMINNVYTNKVEKELNDYLSEIKKNINSYNEEKKLLNTSYNFDIIIKNISENLINKYKEKIKKQIIYKSQMKLMDLINLEEIKQLINNKIDNKYNNDFKSYLRTYSNNISDFYDFNSSIVNEIDSTLNSNFEKIENIISNLNTQINMNDWANLEAKNVEQIIIPEIKSKYDSFISDTKDIEEKEFKYLLNKEIKNNFNITLQNTISLFGKDYLDRYINYNEQSNITLLYYNIRYIFIESLFSYQLIYSFNNKLYDLPDDLIKKIHNLNEIDKTIKNKEDEIFNNLKEEINNLKETIKNDIIISYITNIKNDNSIKSIFNDEINQQIDNYLNNLENKDFEDYYYEIINQSFNETVKTYAKKLDEKTKELVDIAVQQKIEIKEKIPSNTNDDNDNEELDEINSILKKIVNSFDNIQFKFSEEISDRMSKNYTLILNNLKNFTNDIKENIQNEIKKEKEDLLKQIKELPINNNILNITNNIIKTIENYNNNNINYRRMDDNLKTNEEYQSDEITSENKNSTFSELLSSSDNIKNFIDNYGKIDKIIDIIDTSFDKTLTSINNGNYQEDMKEFVSNQLLDLQKEFSNYSEVLNMFITNLTTSIGKIGSLLNELSKNEQNKLKELKMSINNKLQMEKNKNENYNQEIKNFESHIEQNLLKMNFEIENQNNFEISSKDDNSYNPEIVFFLKEKIKLKAKLEFISQNYQITYTFDSNNDSDLNKLQVKLQTYKIDSDFGCTLFGEKNKNILQNENDAINILNK